MASAVSLADALAACTWLPAPPTLPSATLVVDLDAEPATAAAAHAALGTASPLPGEPRASLAALFLTRCLCWCWCYALLCVCVCVWFVFVRVCVFAGSADCASCGARPWPCVAARACAPCRCDWRASRAVRRRRAARQCAPGVTLQLALASCDTPCAHAHSTASRCCCSQAMRAALGRRLDASLVRLRRENTRVTASHAPPIAHRRRACDANFAASRRCGELAHRSKVIARARASNNKTARSPALLVWPGLDDELPDAELSE